MSADFHHLCTVLGVKPASSCEAAKEHLPSGLAALDAFLGGGLASGCLTEWGVPLGRGGRYLVLKFLAAATTARLPALWIYPDSPLQLNPPAWQALGVDLRQVGFARTNAPMQDLRPALLDPYYRFVVFDMPHGLSRDDYAFLAQQARAQDKLILILHNHLLTTAKGNAFAKLRCNSYRTRKTPAELCLMPLRGLPPQALLLPLKVFL